LVVVFVGVVGLSEKGVAGRGVYIRWWREEEEERRRRGTEERAVL
jgi:hypothetical protein